MSFSLSGRALAALIAGGLFFGSCGGNGASTSTPSSTLGTDSAATKVGGMPDSTGASGTMGAPAGGSGSATVNSTDPNTSATGTSSTGNATSNSPAGTAGTPTMGGTGASGTTNSTGAN
jgi:hypothetical protein